MPPIEPWRKIIENRKRNLLRGHMILVQSDESVTVGRIKSVKVEGYQLIIVTEEHAHDRAGRGSFQREHSEKEFTFDISSGPDPKVDRDCISWKGTGKSRKTYTLELLNYGSKKQIPNAIQLAGL